MANTRGQIDEMKATVVQQSQNWSDITFIIEKYQFILGKKESSND